MSAYYTDINHLSVCSILRAYADRAWVMMRAAVYETTNAINPSLSSQRPKA
jgi:hypothetical protein